MTDVLLHKRFHYWFTDGTDIVIEFQDWAFYHLLGMQHIYFRGLTKENIYQKIDKGLDFESFRQDRKMKDRFNDQKDRIELFSCIYQTLRYCRVFYFPDQTIPNTKNVPLDYILYREINRKGLNIGTREVNGCQVPLTMLVDRTIHLGEHLDPNRQKCVSRLLISNIDTGEEIEEFLYTDQFFMKRR